MKSILRACGMVTLSLAALSTPLLAQPATQPATLEAARERIEELELEVAALRARLQRLEGEQAPAAPASRVPTTQPAATADSGSADYTSARQMLEALPADARPGINVGWSKYSAPMATRWFELNLPGRSFASTLTIRGVEASSALVPRPAEPVWTIKLSFRDKPFEHVNLKMVERVEPLVLRGDEKLAKRMRALADGDPVRVRGVIDTAKLHPWGTAVVTLKLRDYVVEEAAPAK